MGSFSTKNNFAQTPTKKLPNDDCGVVLKIL